MNGLPRCILINVIKERVLKDKKYSDLQARQQYNNTKL